MNQSKSIISLKPLIRYNKNFVYKDKKYPIDFNLIINNSNYFYEKREEFANIQDIKLAEDLFDISEESIPLFVSSLHNDPFEINNSNVFSLHQLSIKYEVPHLNSETDQFIQKYGATLIFQSIQYKYKLQQQASNETIDSIDIEKDEEYIATNLFDYIDNEQLLNLPISILYRIINNPKLDINRLNETRMNQLIDFLFKCLDKYKKEASILFLNLDLENQRIELFTKLINEYSDVFDFNMISPKFLMKTTTDLLSQLAQLKQNYSNSVSQVNQLLNKIESNNSKFENIIGQRDELFSQLSQKLDSIGKSLNDRIDQLVSRISKQDESIKEIRNDLSSNEQKISEIEKEKEGIKKQLQELRESVQTMDLIDCSNGIFQYLFDKCGANPIEKGIISIEGNSFNPNQHSILPKLIDPKICDNWVSEDKENSFIKINFVNSLAKIDRYKLIVGNTDKLNHFNSWTLSAITENNQEIVLDDVSNCSQIQDGQTQIIKSVSCSSFVRSIQLTMRGRSSWNDHPYRMIMRNIELFGNLKK